MSRDWFRQLSDAGRRPSRALRAPLLWIGIASGLAAQYASWVLQSLIYLWWIPILFGALALLSGAPFNVSRIRRPNAVYFAGAVLNLVFQVSWVNSRIQGFTPEASGGTYYLTDHGAVRTQITETEYDAARRLDLGLRASFGIALSAFVLLGPLNHSTRTDDGELEEPL